MKKIISLLLGLFLISSVYANNLRIVIPFPPGGSTDQISREFHRALASQGVNAIIEYKIGAGGLIAMNHIASSNDPALLVNGPPILVLPILQKDNVKFNLGENIHFQGLVGIEPTYIVTNTKNSIKSISDLEQMTKIKIVNYGTPGIGTSSSLSVDSIFPDPAQITVVNYKGGSESLQAVLKNEVQIIADSEVVVGSHIAAGTLYPLAVISPVRTKTFPNVPLLKDVSPKRFEEFGLYRWQGVFSNNHVSKEVLDIVKSLLADGQLRDRYSDMGFVVTPSIENNFLDTESKKINRVLKKSK